MKRIIDGVTYNLLTSTPIARSEFEDRDGHEVNAVLYQTRGGAFFLRQITKWAVRRDGEWEERERDDWTPMKEDEAHKWAVEGEKELLSDVFDEPPEAIAESTVSTTIYIRAPEALKRRIEQAADKADQSVNVWAMRCLETCAATALYPDAEFEVDVPTRKVTHKPSKITFSFYEYTSDRAWQRAAPASYRENPNWDGDRMILSIAAKRAAIAGGMKHKKVSRVRWI